MRTMATMAMAKKYKKMEREMKLAKALEAKHEEIEKWFKEYDKDESGDIDRDELGKLMTAVKREATQDAETAPVEDNILDLIMKKYADASGRIKHDRILNAIKAFKSYLAQELTYKDLFAKYDADGSGTLTEAELLPMLKEIAPPPYKTATAGDASFVLSKCDDDKSGTITFDELRPAITTWMELAKEVPPEPEKTQGSSGICALL